MVATQILGTQYTISVLTFDRLFLNMNVILSPKKKKKGNVLRTFANILARFSKKMFGSFSNINRKFIQTYLVFNEVLKTLGQKH